MSNSKTSTAWSWPTQATCIEIPGEETIFWKITFSNGEVKRFKFPVRPFSESTIESATP